MNNYEPNLGIYDMRRDTEGLPKSLANLINKNICMKGGGGGTTVTESGMNKEFVPIYKEAMDDALAGYKDRKSRGSSATVADMTAEQQEALTYQTNDARNKISGTSSYDKGKAHMAELRNRLGSQQFNASGRGNLGSARADKAEAAVIRDQSLQMQKERAGDIKEGIQQLGSAGTTRQKYNQSLIDAPYTEQTRLSGLLSGAPQTSAKTSSGGGK